MYADVQVVRKLAGNVDPTDLSDAEIQVGCTYGDALAELETGHIGWATNDPAYPVVKSAAEYIASKWVRDHYRDQDHQADKHYQTGLDMLKTVRQTSPESLFVLAMPYRTFPLNKSAPMYRSLPSGGGMDTTIEPTGQADADFNP